MNANGREWALASIESLFRKIDPEQWEGKEVLPVDDDWRRLALLLALKHGEITYKSDIKKPRRAEPDEIRRDELMETYIYYELRFDRESKETYFASREKPLSVAAASRLVKKYLDKGTDSIHSKKVPTQEAIRTQYVKRTKERVESGHAEIRLQGYLRQFIESREKLSLLESVAGKLAYICEQNKV